MPSPKGLRVKVCQAEDTTILWLSRRALVSLPLVQLFLSGIFICIW